MAATLAVLLRHIHGLIGAADQRLRRLRPVEPRENRADGEAERKALDAEFAVEPPSGFVKALGNRFRRRAAGLLQPDQELVAADAGGEIQRTHEAARL